jgi:hypothetical protein
LTDVTFTLAPFSLFADVNHFLHCNRFLSYHRINPPTMRARAGFSLAKRPDHTRWALQQGEFQERSLGFIDPSWIPRASGGHKYPHRFADSTIKRFGLLLSVSPVRRYVQQ